MLKDNATAFRSPDLYVHPHRVNTFAQHLSIDTLQYTKQSIDTHTCIIVQLVHVSLDWICGMSIWIETPSLAVCVRMTTHVTCIRFVVAFVFQPQIKLSINSIWLCVCVSIFCPSSTCYFVFEQSFQEN